ncbi:MAG: aminoacyl-histidine dipeptidase [Clostridiales bacterium]|nr:aminoacyl-histidine dipeptidase [Clostridiales bacterium]
MSVLSNLEPRSVFSFFETICSIPHPSGREDRLADYIVSFAQARGLEHYRDELNNVIVIKPAFPGYESQPPVIIQGHLDMACEQEPGRNMDFDRQGLDLLVDDGWVTARGTTLGGDDGIAVAYALALLDGDDIPHPRLEVVLTTSEEVGMEGAAAIDLSPLQGRRLLNIDSEEEGFVLSSCAGGCRADCLLPIERTEAEGQLCTLTLSGLTGGHSGTEIDKGRANAIHALADVLAELERQLSFFLRSLQGGGKDNAIPRDATAEIVLSSSRMLPVFSAALERCHQSLGQHYGQSDPGLRLSLIPREEGTWQVLTPEAARRGLTLIQNLPDGVQAMSRDIPGLVETSLNLGVADTRADALHLRLSLRSSVLADKEALKNQVAQTTENLGGSVSWAGDYPPWEYRQDSPLREDVCRAWESLTGKRPEVVAIHAGLECGLLSAKLPGMDAVSIGPNMQDIHTTEERLEIVSVGRVWELILKVLAQKK